MNFLKLPGRILFRSGVSSSVFVITVAVFIFIFYAIKNTEGNKPPTTVSSPQIPAYNSIHEEGYELIRPLLLTESKGHDQTMSHLESQLNAMVANYKSSGKAKDVSIYLKRFASTYPIEINSSIQYFPGSLMKVPVLIGWLKKAEYDPELLNKKFFLSDHFITGKKLNLSEEPLQVGHTYTVKELMHYMISESSNDAVGILLSNIEFERLQKVFSDLSLPEPKDANALIFTDASSYSRFLRVLFNSSYLNRKSSQFALSLLQKTNFKKGLTANTPDSIKVAHKFGESGSDSEPQLHEAGIFYYKNEPYILVVMTSGYSFGTLGSILTEISDTVLQFMQKQTEQI